MNLFRFMTFAKRPSPRPKIHLTRQRPPFTSTDTSKNNPPRPPYASALGRARTSSSGVPCQPRYVLIHHKPFACTVSAAFLSRSLPIASFNLGKKSLAMTLSEYSFVLTIRSPLSSKSRSQTYSLTYSPAAVSALALSHMQMRGRCGFDASSISSSRVREKLRKMVRRDCRDLAYEVVSWGGWAMAVG